MPQDAELIAKDADAKLQLATASLLDVYFYQSLPLCVIDAVYSIGVLYKGVENVVSRYCDSSKLLRIRLDKQSLPSLESQESVSSFCEKLKENGAEKMANEIFRNKQRTSAKNGILKAEAVYRFACVLRDHGVNFFQDLPKVKNDAPMEREILRIPGQHSGISLQYFWMLAGDNDLIKPDRMILRYIKDVIGRDVSLADAQDLLSDAAKQLLMMQNDSKPKYPNITPRLLDYKIWEYQRNR